MILIAVVVACTSPDDDENPMPPGTSTTPSASTTPGPPCDVDGDGFDVGSCGGPDCDDTDPAVHPDGPEICNDQDDNCDGLTDDADPQLDPSTAIAWWSDLDGDGFGGGSPVFSCVVPPDGSLDGSDCDDTLFEVHPGANEVCNEIDDDCDGWTDDADSALDLTTATRFYEDADGDGYGDPAVIVLQCEPVGAVLDATDCAPDDPSSHAAPPWWVDADGDGYGDPLQPATLVVCHQLPGTAGNPDDCDDNDAEANVGTVWYSDVDEDGYGDPDAWITQCLRPDGSYVVVAGDCDDDAAVRNPGADEVCDGADDDCDGVVDEGVLITWFEDSDNDLWGNAQSTKQGCGVPPEDFVLYSGDCDELDWSIHPDATETCDGIDNNCDGMIDSDFIVGAATIMDEVRSEEAEIADLDADGDADIVAALYDDASVAFYANQGDGAFDAAVVLVGALYADVEVVDLDQDGVLDVIVAGDDLIVPGQDGFGWLRGLGGAAFEPLALLETAFNPISLDTSDLDEDGDLDVVAAWVSDDQVLWYENLGSGMFGPGTPLTEVEIRGPSVVLTPDLDGDGDPDVVIASAENDYISWLPNLGGGSFGPPVVVSSAVVETFQLEIADLDGDGDTDLITTDEFDNELWWFENDGDGLFGGPREIDFNFATVPVLQVADLDGDGDLDVFFAEDVNLEQEFVWYENLGGGAFGPPQVIVEETLVNWIRVADINDDGTMDVVAAFTFYDSTIEWFAGTPIDDACP